jgi:hypothetical protein
MRAMLAILVVLAAAAPASAQSPPPELFPLHACYRSAGENARETVGIVSNGFTPGAEVSVTVGGTTLPDNAVADENGQVLGSVFAPFQANGVRPFSITLTEVQLPEKTVTRQSMVAALTVRLKPRTARPSSRVRFLGRGFTDGPAIYGHYVRAGKVRKTVAFGAPQGPCGRLDVVRRQIPVRHPATGRWTLQIDNQRSYSEKPATAFVRLGITVRRVAGRA